MNDAKRPRFLCHDQRRAARSRDAVDDRPQFSRRLAAVRGDVLLDGIGGAFAHFSPVQIDARHSRLRRERNEHRALVRELAFADAVLLLREDDDGAAFGRFVGERRKLGRVGDFALGYSRHWHELSGLTVTEGNRSGLIEQQRVDVSCRFDRTAGHRQHIALHQAIHAGDADGREQAADGCWDEADEQRDEDEHGLRRA